MLDAESEVICLEPLFQHQPTFFYVLLQRMARDIMLLHSRKGLSPHDWATVAKGGRGQFCVQDGERLQITNVRPF